MHKVNRKEGKYTWLSLVFFVFLIFIVIVWILFKLVFLIYESKISLGGEFAIDFYNHNNNQVVLFKHQSKIKVININNISPQAVPMKFEIPIEEFVKSDYLVSKSDFSQFFNREILSSNSLNLVDKVKLFYLLKKSKVNFYSFSSKMSSKNSLISSIFSDSTIYTENKTIAIVNATGQNGYADSLANLITNIGGNVISTTASPYTLDKSTIIYTNNQSYTLNRIEKILNFSVKLNTHSQNAIADIIINIGKDQINTTKF